METPSRESPDHQKQQTCEEVGVGEDGFFDLTEQPPLINKKLPPPQMTPLEEERAKTPRTPVLHK